MAKRESYRDVRREKYTQVSNSFLSDPSVTLQAKGLLSIFLSNSSDWDIYMSEIITRSKNGRDAHYKVVNELISLGYFARIQVLDEKNRFEEMVYIFSDIKKDVAEEIQRVGEWANENNKNLKIDYENSKNTPFTENQDTDENPFTENQDPETPKAESQYNNNNKDKNTRLNNKNKNIDDDKRTKGSAIHNEETINLIVSNFREMTKDELTERSFKAVVRKVVDKHSQGKVNSFRDYLATALANKMEELELRKAKAEAREQLKANMQQRVEERKEKLEKQPIREVVPFYNWLEK